jgi:hypothetical protein
VWFEQEPRLIETALHLIALAQDLARVIRAAAAADTPQSARAAASVKAHRDRVPVISAGATKRARAVLFGSEFGMTRRSGWYGHPRYRESLGRPYRPHRGNSSYWFFRTVEQQQGRISEAWNELAANVVRRWRA